jgi:hypothetical protein
MVPVDVALAATVDEAVVEGVAAGVVEAEAAVDRVAVAVAVVEREGDGEYTASAANTARMCPDVATCSVVQLLVSSL